MASFARLIRGSAAGGGSTAAAGASSASARGSSGAIRRHRPVRIRLVRFLTLILAVLVAVPTLVALAIGLSTAGRNTQSLLKERIRLLRAETVERTEQFLAPATALPAFLGARIEAGDLNAGDAIGVARAIRFAYAAAPQLNAVAFAHKDGWMALSVREPDGRMESEVRSWRDDPVILPVIREIESQGLKPRWTAPLFIPNAGTTVVSFAQPVTFQGAYVGSVTASIRVDVLSRFAQETGSELHEELFILYGRDHVLAHPAMAQDKVPLSASHPLPALGEVGDPVLAQLWQPGWIERPSPGSGPGHEFEVDGRGYLAVYQTLPLPSDTYWMAGGYVARDLVDKEVDRLMIAAGIGLVALIGAIAVAVLVGRKLSGPAEALADASVAVGRLEFGDVPQLRPSRLVELDEAARAFNAMTAALDVFRRYVPQRLVQTLIRLGDGAVASEMRVVTIMFTDIVDFTATAEGMSAQACARVLNEHFSTLIDCVEAEGGTVDKLMGDALMAFWGAPEPQADHARHAVRAAQAMRRALPATHRAEADPPVRLRIGLHTGSVLVGNIGSPHRLSYTVIGDAVNVAQRLEQLGKLMRRDADVAILLSGETADRLGGSVPLTDLGRHQVRGRSASITIYALDDDAPAAADQTLK